MKAKVTSKGQVTIPQLIRTQANIVAGSQLDFQIEDNGTLVVHLVTQDISKLRGMVKSKRKKPATLKEMKKAISDSACRNMK